MKLDAPNLDTQCSPFLKEMRICLTVITGQRMYSRFFTTGRPRPQKVFIQGTCSDINVHLRKRTYKYSVYRCIQKNINQSLLFKLVHVPIPCIHFSAKKRLQDSYPRLQLIHIQVPHPPLEGGGRGSKIGEGSWSIHRD